MGCMQQPDNKTPSELGLKSFLRRAQVGLNFFLSAIGSMLYLLGSICFIPQTNEIVLGENLFIFGSLIIFLSQLWKCLRTMFCCGTECKFNWENVSKDYPGFFVDAFAGLGGLSYAVGTYYFKNALTGDDMIDAVNLFVIGGLSFFISGLSMQYRYFFHKECKEECKPADPNQSENKDAKVPLIESKGNEEKDPEKH